MAFLEVLQEMLTRSQVADLARTVAVMSVDRDKEGNPRKFLNFNYARNGEVEWVEANAAGPFMLKGKFLKDVYPLIKGKLGKAKFIDRDEIRSDQEYGQAGAIRSDSPTVGFARSSGIGSAD